MQHSLICADQSISGIGGPPPTPVRKSYLNLVGEVSFNAGEVLYVASSINQCKSLSCLSSPACTTDPVYVILKGHRHLIVDDMRYIRHVYPGVGQKWKKV